MSFLTSIESAADGVAAFVKKELAAIDGDATKVIAVADDAATIANNLVNSLKMFSATPEGQTIEAVIEAVPLIGPYVSDVLKYLPTLVADLGWATSEFTKSPAQVVTDGITAVLNGTNANVKATNLISLVANINTFISGLQGSATPIATAAAIAPAVYAASALPVTAPVPAETTAPESPAPVDNAETSAG